MPRVIKAKYISEDCNFEDYVLLMAPDLTLEVNGSEWTFRKIPPVSSGQGFVEIDLDACPIFELAFPLDLSVDMEWLKGATFLEVIRMLTLANKKGGN